MSERGDEATYEVVEAGTGGKTFGPFGTEAEAEEYVEDRFGESPASTAGRVIWRGESRPGRSRYVLKLRETLTDGGAVPFGEMMDDAIDAVGNAQNRTRLFMDVRAFIEDGTAPDELPDGRSYRWPNPTCAEGELPEYKTLLRSALKHFYDGNGYPDGLTDGGSL